MGYPGHKLVRGNLADLARRVFFSKTSGPRTSEMLTFQSDDIVFRQGVEE